MADTRFVGTSFRTANQPPPLAGYNLFSENRPLVEALRREGDAAEEERCSAFGRLCGGEPLELGRLANGRSELSLPRRQGQRPRG